MIKVTGYRLALTCVGLVFSTPGLATAQTATPVRIPDEPTCGACRITLTTFATLGDTDGPGALANIPYGVRVDGRDRIWLWGGDNAGGPSIYDANGKFLRVSGRRGQGPGEFEMITDVITLPGDSVLVVDYNRRATLYSTDLSVMRTHPADDEPVFRRLRCGGQLAALRGIGLQTATAPEAVAVLCCIR